MARDYWAKHLWAYRVVSLFHSLAYDARIIYTKHNSELGIATHYIAPSALSSIIRELSNHPNPTLANLSALISTYTSPFADGPGSKQNPDGSAPLSPEVRKFLDETFALDNIAAIHAALGSAASNDKSEDVRTWAGEQLKLIDARSPTGMAVALEGVRRAKAEKRLDVVLKNGMYHLSDLFFHITRSTF